MDGQQSPLLVLLCHWREEGRESGIKLSPGKKKEWVDDILKIWVYFSLACSDLIGNKFKYSP